MKYLAVLLVMANPVALMGQQSGNAIWAQGVVFAAEEVNCCAENDDGHGVWIGGRGGLRFGAIALNVEGLAGQLDIEDRQNEHSDYRVSTVSLLVHAPRVVGFGLSADAIRFVEPDQPTVDEWIQRRIGFILELSGDLGFRGLETFFTAAAYPFIHEPRELEPWDVMLNDGADINHRLVVGLRLLPPTVPIIASLEYRVERFVGSYYEEIPIRGMMLALGIYLD